MDGRRAIRRGVWTVAALAPLAGCHVIFGYSAGESPAAERAVDTTRPDWLMRDRPSVDWGPSVDRPPGYCTPLESCVAGQRPDRCNAKGEVEPRCSECGCPGTSDLCCADGRCSSPGHDCHIFLYANADAYLSSDLLTQNFGQATELLLSDNGALEEEVVLGFPLTLGPEVTITSATLHLQVVGGSDTPFAIGHVLQQWNEHTITYSSVSYSMPSLSPVLLRLGENLVDVKTAIIDWIKNKTFGLHLHGVIFVSPRAKIASREHKDAGYHPLLEITYYK